MQNLLSLARLRTAGRNSAGAPLGPAYLNLTGVAADNASTADKAALDLSSGLEVIACVALADWTPSATQTIIGKYNTTGNLRSYRLEILGTGNPALGLSELGTAVSTGNAGAAVGAADGSARWLKVTWRASDGRMQAFTSTDPPGGAIPTNWVQLGTNQTIALIGLFNSSEALFIGRQGSPGGPLPTTGKIYRMILKDAPDGTTVADFNPDGRVGSTSWADAYGNTWAINGAASIRR